MKQIFSGVFLFALISVIVISCDKVEDPFPPNLDVDEEVWDDSSKSNPNTERYILLEEFTGHTCRNCPGGAKEIDRLRNIKYGEKFIPIAIHVTETFAAPKAVAGAPPEAFTSDHRTEESEIYFNVPEFGSFSLPKGMVSRTKGNLNVNEWVRECDKIYNNGESAVANIDIKTYFHSPSGTFKVAVSIEWLDDYTGDMNLQIQVVEDSIVDWQDSLGTFLPDYEHKHMFRGSVNGAWGTPLDETKTAGQRTDTSFTRSIEPYLGRVRKFDLANYEKPDFHDWEVIVFIYKDAPDYEVMQVNEAHLTSSH